MRIHPLERKAQSPAHDQKLPHTPSMLDECWARYRSLFHDSLLPIFLLDLSPVKTFLDRIALTIRGGLGAYLTDHPAVTNECIRRSKIIDMNEACLAFFGADRELQVTENIRAFLTRDSWLAFQQALANLGEGRLSFEQEMPLRDLKGKERSVVCKLSVIHGFEDSFGRVHASFMDITEQKHLERKLGDREKGLKALGDHLPGCLIYSMQTNADGSYAYVHFAGDTKGFCGASAESLEDDPGKFWQAFEKEDREQIIHDFMHSKNTIQSFDFELPVTTKGKGLSWYSLRFVQYLLPRGGREQIGLLYDISSRKSLEAELARKHYLLRTILDTIPLQIYVKDLGGRIVLANPEVVRAFGKAREDELIGKTNDDLYPPEVAELHNKDEATILATGHTIQKEESVDSSDGSRRWYAVTKAPIWSGRNEYLGLVGINHDITKTKMVEENLRKSELAAEAANEAKSTFIANISHEIRTPLNAIIGFSQLLQRGTETQAKEAYLDRILSSARILLELINNILDVSKINSGKLTLESSPFDIRGIVDSILAMLSLSAVEKGIVLRQEVSADVPARLVGDSLCLKQVLLNICGNAVKYTDAGRVEVTISVKQRLGDRILLRFTVRDTGIGISPEDRSKLFTPFFQVDSSTSRKHGGTGLGLVISKGIVEAMGGEIDVESEPGNGSLFHFTAWFEIEKDGAKSILPPIATNRATGPSFSGSPPILLVEDNEANVLLTKEMLESAGARVRVATNGEAALQAIGEREYKAVLLDLHMPGMSGYEVAEKIRENPVYQRIPIIAITADVQVRETAKHNAIGLDDCIVKPFEYAELINVLNRWLTIATHSTDMRMAELNKSDAKRTQNDLDALEFAGIDIVNGQARALGKETLYRQMLAAFLKTQTKTAERVDLAIKRRDMKEAILAVHTTKGAAGNIGAEQLRSAATIVESNLRRGTDPRVDGSLDLFHSELQRVLIALKTLSSLERTTNPSEARVLPGIVDARAVVPLIEKLERQLSTGSASSLSTRQ